MKNHYVLLFLLCLPLISLAQTTQISGKVLHDKTGNIIPSVTIWLEGTPENKIITSVGNFVFNSSKKGSYILILSVPDFIPKKFLITLEGTPINLGTIYLEPDITTELTDNLITLTENDLSDDEGTLSASTGLLQATRDVFLNRAAFDFGQAFFRVRGYDSREGQVLINGLVMNKFIDGRPQWNNWGGLNDIVRNQEFTNGLEVSNYTFGGILGNTNINMRPSGLRSGTRLSTSFSNRTYSGRLMATHTSPINNKGIGYTISGSRRWAKEGYINGTLYDAYSLFGALEYNFNPKNTISLTGIIAKNRRGSSSAITEEVFELQGKQYNPYWGNQNGEIRNARERNIFEPIVLLNHYFRADRLRIMSGIALQTGTRTRSRLGYFNAPNPDPTYYRYLPSFYINNSIGADFTNAALAREGFLNNPQTNWNALYTANTNPERQGKAAYVLYDDTVNDTQYSLSSTASYNLSATIQMDFGISYRSLHSANYAEIKDLLGAGFHEDIDPFSNTQNDINGDINKTEGEIFNYNYFINTNEWSAFTQILYNKNKWSGFLSGSLGSTTYQREGLFENERFLDSSLGKSNSIKFNNFGLKSGLAYQITGRHWLKGHLAFTTRPPTLQNTFINPRENNQLVPNLKTERLFTTDVNYFIRLPKITGRLTGFYTQFNNTTDINFFFVDAGVGSDFVQEVITDLDKTHMGLELGLEYQTSPEVKLTLAANLGNYIYSNNPNVTINFDTAGADEDVINPDGNINLGAASLKNLKIAQGPQTALAFGVSYRAPKYWWISTTANYLANNYANIATITRTDSFLLNPETGIAFPDATPENVSRLLEQKPLDNFYLLNVVGGKSWLIDGKYISLFASINNLFDETFRTGGYEQSRNGNFGQLQQDNLRNDPSFAPKYWYGFGRTFFLNLAVSF